MMKHTCERIMTFVLVLGSVVSGTIAQDKIDLGKEKITTYFEIRSNDKIHWKEWDEETLRLVKDVQKPIILSISHQASSLTQSMGKESFSNDKIAELINKNFVAIAIDKNTLPQVAGVYAAYASSAKQIYTWPLTLFLTPDLVPIDGGGYLPVSDEWGNHGLSTTLVALSKQWEDNPGDVIRRAAIELNRLDKTYGLAAELSQACNSDFLRKKIQNLLSDFDPIHGGFSMAPKELPFLEIQLIEKAMNAQLIENEDEFENMKTLTLRHILNGGVYDPVRGGFFSGTIESSWSIPIFKKTVSAQYEAIQYLSQHPEYDSLVTKILQLFLRDFHTSNGLFTETLMGLTPEQQLNEAPIDGFIYSWSSEELQKILSPEEFVEFSAAYTVLANGNLTQEQDFSNSFSERNILRKNTAYKNENPALLQKANQKTLIESLTRGDLIQEPVVSLQANAVVLYCLTNAAERLSGDYQAKAIELEQNMWNRFFDPKTEVLTASEKGQASSLGYALYIRALLAMGKDLPENTYSQKAKYLQAILDTQFYSEKGLYLIANKANTELLLPLYALNENEFGSANSVSITNLNQLCSLFNDNEFRIKSEKIRNSLPKHFNYMSDHYPHLLLSSSLKTYQ